MSTHTFSWTLRADTFPRFTPLVPNLDYYAECRPADGRGGDFFDFVALDDGALALCLGEAAGRAQAASGMQSFLDSLHRPGANPAVAEFDPAVFYACIDPVLRQLVYFNLFHETALVVRKRPFRVFDLRSGPSWEQRRMALEPADVLVAYTSGVSRAVREQEVVAAIRESGEARAGSLVAGILEAAGGRDARAAGDRTVLAVRITGTEEPAMAEEADELSLAVA